MSARRGEPVFGADDPGSRRLPLAPRSRSVEARAPAPGEVGVEPRVASEAGEARDATRPTTRSTDAIAGREEAARADTGEGSPSTSEARTAATVRTAQSARRGAGKLTLEVGEDEVPQLVRSGKANQVRSSVLATRVLEEAVGALKERGHGDASKQSVQEMLLLALRGVAPDALVALHKQYRTLLQDAREAEAASLLA
jgi:hypothetical protein